MTIHMREQWYFQVCLLDNVSLSLRTFVLFFLSMTIIMANSSIEDIHNADTHTLGVSSSLVSRWREAYSFWSS